VWYCFWDRVTCQHINYLIDRRLFNKNGGKERMPPHPDQILHRKKRLVSLHCHSRFHPFFISQVLTTLFCSPTFVSEFPRASSPAQQAAGSGPLPKCQVETAPSSSWTLKVSPLPTNSSTISLTLTPYRNHTPPNPVGLASGNQEGLNRLFTFSVLLSSVLVLNVMRQVNDDTLDKLGAVAALSR